jgi:hypothetical protein
VQVNRLPGGWKVLLVLYLVSFALPVEDGWGVSAFVVTSLMVLVLAVALALASFPTLFRILRGLLVLPGE